AQDCVHTYMKSSITQIERRFGVPSSFIGLIDGSFEIGNLLVVTAVSYFGAKHHRPQIIGAGLLIVSLVFSSHLFDLEWPVCVSKMNAHNSGFGEAPILPLGISYMDDHSKEENLAFYPVALIGPIFGFLLGSFCAKLFVDIGFVNQYGLTITPNDARWVGAWWLGFLIAGVLIIIAAIPLFFFPKSMPSKGERKKIEKKAEGLTADGFMPSLKQLFYSPIFTLFGVYSILDANAWIGLFTFNPKFIEQQYGQSTSRVNYLIGQYFLVFVTMKYFALFYKISKLAAANLPTKYTVNSLYGLFHEHNLVSVCNSDCTCSKTQWEPVCAVNGLTYISPCLEFHNCSCVLGSTSDNSSVILGQCQKGDGCEKTCVYFLIVTGLSSFFYSFGITPSFAMLLRSVKQDLKSFTIGILMLLIRIFGGIPVPIHFGAMTCLKWGSEECGVPGACRIYDNDRFRYIVGIMEGKHCTASDVGELDVVTGCKIKTYSIFQQNILKANKYKT
uniref:Kazal-like domain-containing protein n=1 Tax=Callorhinchus milii TaxID=7868 RepID=A0A4W3I9W0_CALMI